MPVKTPTTNIFLGVNATVNATGHLLWTINDRTFRDDDSNPILLLANDKKANHTYDPYWNVYDLGSNSTVRIVVQNEQAAATNISHVSCDFQIHNSGARLTPPAIPHARA